MSSGDNLSLGGVFGFPGLALEGVFDLREEKV